MDFFFLFLLYWAVSVYFLFGMNMMGDSLKNLAGGSLEKILEKLTTGKSKATGAIKGFGLGTAVTAIIQSSAATTIMLIGFVNAGIMKLGQAIPVVFGANVGSTATAQILRLGDLGEDMFILKLLKPSSFAPVLIGIGAFIILFAKKRNHIKILPELWLVLVFFFLGMNTMESVFAPLKRICYLPESVYFIQQSASRHSDWFGSYSSHSEFFCFCRYSSGIVLDRRCNLRFCNTNYYWYEHR